MRVMVQGIVAWMLYLITESDTDDTETWLPVSADKAEMCGDPGKASPGQSTNGAITTCGNRDAATAKSLGETKAKWEAPFELRLRTQLEGLNKQFGVNFTTLVPVWSGFLALRKAVVEGKVPGVAKQSALFADGLGHAKQPLKDMASYSKTVSRSCQSRSR